MKALKGFYARKNGKLTYYKEGDDVDCDHAEKMVRLGLVEKNAKPKRSTKNGKPNTEDK